MLPVDVEFSNIVPNNAQDSRPAWKKSYDRIDPKLIDLMCGIVSGPGFIIWEYLSKKGVFREGDARFTVEEWVPSEDKTVAATQGFFEQTLYPINPKIPKFNRTLELAVYKDVVPYIQKQFLRRQDLREPLKGIEEQMQDLKGIEEQMQDLKGIEEQMQDIDELKKLHSQQRMLYRMQRHAKYGPFDLPSYPEQDNSKDTVQTLVEKFLNLPEVKSVEKLEIGRKIFHFFSTFHKLMQGLDEEKGPRKIKSHLYMLKSFGPGSFALERFRMAAESFFEVFCSLHLFDRRFHRSDSSMGRLLRVIMKLELPLRKNLKFYQTIYHATKCRYTTEYVYTCRILSGIEMIPLLLEQNKHSEAFVCFAEVLKNQEDVSCDIDNLIRLSHLATDPKKFLGKSLDRLRDLLPDLQYKKITLESIAPYDFDHFSTRHLKPYRQSMDEHAYLELYLLTSLYETDWKSDRALEVLTQIQLLLCKKDNRKYSNTIMRPFVEGIYTRGFLSKKPDLVNKVFLELEKGLLLLNNSEEKKFYISELIELAKHLLKPAKHLLTQSIQMFTELFPIFMMHSGGEQVTTQEMLEGLSIIQQGVTTYRESYLKRLKITPMLFKIVEEIATQEKISQEKVTPKMVTQKMLRISLIQEMAPILEKAMQEKVEKYQLWLEDLSREEDETSS